MFRLLAVLAFVCAGLAAVTARAAPPIEAYGRLPAMENVSLSPSGARYAYIVVDGDARKLVVATVDSNQALFACDVGKAKVISVYWAGDDHLLVEVSHTVDLGPAYVSKDELATVISINLKTGTAISVLTSSFGVMPVVFGVDGSAQINGRWFGYFGGFSGDVVNLYRVDLDNAVTTLAAHGVAASQRWLVGPDGTVIARTLYHEKTGDWAVLAGDDASDPLSSGRDPFGGVGLLARGRTPDSILVYQPGDQENVFMQEPLSGAPAEVADEVGKIDEPLFDRKSHLWIGQIDEGDTPEATLFDPAWNERLQAVQRTFKGLSVRLYSYDGDFNRLIVFTSGAGDSGTYWLVDVAAHKANPLGYAYPDVQPTDVGQIRMVTWKAADGLELHGVLSLPPGREAKNLPVVVMPHGGPEDRDYPVFDWWAQAFVARGYSVFQPNFRGSSDYGKAFRDAGFGQWGRKMQTDISDGLAELARQGIVDPKRACTVGWSYGGYAALAGVTVQNGLYRCSVSMAGVSNPPAFLKWSADRVGSIGATTRYWKAFMGVTSPFRNDLGAISPTNLANRADAPVLLIHGKDDTVVPYLQAVEMVDALKRAGKPVEFVPLEGADHWLLKEDTRIAMAKASVAFVEKYNPPDPAPAPAPVQASSATSAPTP
jgi:pimeloyl-ACP methyl ester carboxylesterase